MFENKLKYEFYPNGVNVITYGDIGEKFYITLHGTLSVFLPTSEFKKKCENQWEFNEKNINKKYC